jgi:hypothetical protein
VSDDFDRDVRVAVYRHFIDEGEPPSVVQVAGALERADEEVETAFRRLEAARVLVFAPGTLNIWMANPLCAFPTSFRVTTDRGSWWGTCVWDAFGIPAMLGADATITSSCPDCSGPMEFRVEGGSLTSGEGVAHFAVPARDWWDNIGYT